MSQIVDELLAGVRVLRVRAEGGRGAPSLSPTARMLIEAGRTDRARWLEAECDALRAEVARLKAQLDAADRRGRDTR